MNVVPVAIGALGPANDTLVKRTTLENQVAARLRPVDDIDPPNTAPWDQR